MKYALVALITLITMGAPDACCAETPAQHAR